ncbi:MAG: cytochrome c [Gemmatimonadetes bacterium]|nr:cytochrome c [Gemmatimonadota bacterium]
MRRFMCTVVVALIASACSGGTRAETGELPASGRYELGRAATAAEIAAQDIDIGPDGLGLPAGSGTVAQGAMVFGAQCASCHGVRGEGISPFPQLIGREPRAGFPFGRDPRAVKTIGNYWPYATTLFDYVRRAMPQLTPGSLSDDEVYAVTAWLLAQNEVIAGDVVLNAETLRLVKMPARDRFVVDDRKGGPEIR